jgi:ATP-dependent Clp protease protease subunit
MNAPEAKDFGLVDEVMGDVSDVVVLSRSEITMSIFKKQLDPAAVVAS